MNFIHMMKTYKGKLAEMAAGRAEGGSGAAAEAEEQPSAGTGDSAQWNG